MGFLNKISKYKPSSLLSFKFLSSFLLFIILCLYIFPFGRYFFLSIKSLFVADEISIYFLKSIFVSSFSSILQALVSSFFTLVLSIVFSFFLFKNINSSVASWVENLGLWLFAVPSVYVSVLIFIIKFNISFSLPSLIWIVLVHIFVNVLFFTFLLVNKISSVKKSLLYQNYFILIINYKSKIIARTAFWFHSLKKDLITYLGIIFIWSFNSFAPILMFASDPWFITPEVLFFTEINNFGEEYRSGLIFLINIIFTIFFWRYFNFSSFNSFLSSNKKISLSYKNRILSLFLLISFLVFVFLKYSGLGGYLLNTLILCTATFVLFAIIFICLTECSFIIRKIFSSIIFFSAFVIASTGYLAFSSIVNHSVFYQYLISGFYIVMAWVPFLSILVNKQSKHINKNILIKIKTQNFTFLRKWLILFNMYYRELFTKFSFIVLVSSFGSLSIPLLFIKDKVLLSVFSESLKNNYDFSYSYIICILSFAFVFIFFMLENIYLKKVRDVHNV